MSKPASEPLSPEAVARLEREQALQPVNGGGNALRYIRESVGPEIAEKIKERDAAIAVVRRLNTEIVSLMTHQQVSDE